MNEQVNKRIKKKNYRMTKIDSPSEILLLSSNFKCVCLNIYYKLLLPKTYPDMFICIILNKSHEPTSTHNPREL